MMILCLINQLALLSEAELAEFKAFMEFWLSSNLPNDAVVSSPTVVVPHQVVFLSQPVESWRCRSIYQEETDTIFTNLISSPIVIDTPNELAFLIPQIAQKDEAHSPSFSLYCFQRAGMPERRCAIC